MKKVIVISTSLRAGSNSDMLADQFIAGAIAAGNDVQKISLADKQLAFCKGCLACQKLGKCVIDDDANIIMRQVLNADVVCWATPIYYYEMSGQMLVGVAGRGWYQEEGKPAQEILPGTVIHMPANVKHWHGAAKDSWFAHLAFEIPGENTSNEWLQPVNDEQYDNLK